MSRGIIPNVISEQDAGWNIFHPYVNRKLDRFGPIPGPYLKEK